MTVGGNASASTYNSTYEVAFYDASSKIVNFSHNFSASSLDLSRVRIIKETNAVIINLSGQLQANANKTIYLADNSFVALCVKDAEIGSSSDISSGCNGANETDFTSCLGGSATVNGIVCTDEGSVIRIDNLRYSGVQGTPASPSPATNPSGSSSTIASKNNLNVKVIKDCAGESLAVNITAINNRTLYAAELSVYKGNSTAVPNRAYYNYLSSGSISESVPFLSDHFDLTLSGDYTLLVRSSGYYDVVYRFSLDECIRSLEIEMQPEEEEELNVSSIQSDDSLNKNDDTFKSGVDEGILEVEQGLAEQGDSLVADQTGVRNAMLLILGVIIAILLFVIFSSRRSRHHHRR